MNKIIFCPEKLPEKKDIWVFLMGPIQGAPDFHSLIQSLPEISGVTFLSPRRKDTPEGSEDKREVFSDEDYRKQVEWETKGLRYCDLILCWIPKSSFEVPGRQYAQTTCFELGENLARGKRIIIGVDPDIPGRRYFEKKSAQYHQGPIYSTLEECLEKLQEIIKEKRGAGHPKLWFTADTHFGIQRTLDFSCRPFDSVDEMDDRMIENWNKVVSPWDHVFHLGDFGDWCAFKYLNGSEKTLVLGNYEEEDRVGWGVSIEEYVECLLDYGWTRVFERYTFLDDTHRDLPEFILCHEPSIGKEVIDSLKTCSSMPFVLFGHVHKLSMIKEFGMCVSQDCHNFCPVGEDFLKKFLKGIKPKWEGRDDEEVFL